MPEYAHLVIAFTKIWEEFVEVKWEKIHFDGARLKRYHLLATSDKYKVERLFEPTENRYKLVGLEPGCELKVSVRAQFEGGEWGNWCSSEAVLHKQCSVTVGMVGPAFIHGHFNWGTDAESSETKTYGAAAGFQLRVRQKEKVLSTAVCDQELEAGQREFVVRGLLPDAIFNVQVRAVSAQGDVGRWSEVTRFLTLRDVVVHITEIGEDYSNIWWGRERADIGAAPPSAGSPSALEQFELRLDLHPTANQLLANLASDPVAVAEQSFGSDVCTYKLEALIPGRVYSIRTRQLNVQGDWSPWTSAKFRTLSRTSMVSAEAVSHDFMLISWGQERQEGTEAEMDLTTEVSVVNWQVRCVNTKTKEQSMVVLPAGETTTKIVNLPTSTEFALSARAKTSFGQWGPWSEASYVATVAPLQVRVEAVGEGWLKLNWARPEKRCDDAIQRYHVQIVAASSSFRLSKYFPADVTEYRFEDLSPNTEFLASIQACIADRWQPFSDALPTKTAGTAAVHLVRRGEDFIQIRWSSDFYDLNRVDPLDQKYQVKIIRHAPAGVDGAEDAPDECVTCQEFENVFGYRITKLTPGASVTIQARAFNASKEAWGGWSQPEVMKTLQSVISYTMIGETCVEAVWQRKPRTVSAVSDLVPVDNDPLAPSEAVMYILRVNRVHDDGTVTPLEKYHFTDQDKPFFLIENLEPNTTYSAQLCTADAQQTWSPWSAAAVVTTVPPIKLTIHEIGEDYCKVDWKRETLHAPASPSSASSPRALLHDDVETKYRITATSLVLDANGGLAAGSQLKYFVEGEQSFTLRHLEQDTSYRLSISAYPKNTNVWGVWSDAVYLRTCPSIDVELDTIGEDFARVSWRRKSPSSDLEKLHPCCEVVLVGGAAAAVEGDDAASRLTVMRNGVIAEQLSGLSPTPGYPLHIARPVVTQYCVKVYALGKSEEGEDTKTVQFESKLADGVTSLRIPQLEPNKAYEVVASACSSSGEWGVMSEPMPLQTTMSTEVFVASITYSYIRVKWGKGGPTATQALTEGEDDDTGVAPVAAADGEAPPVQQYLVQIVGPDDDFSKEVTLPGTQTQYDIHGLCINCCYSVSIRALQEGVWGHWSNPLVIAVRAIRVRMVEASQDWLKLSWYNRAVPEGQQRQLFITLIGDGRAMTRTLPSGSDTEFVFSELTPLTVYAVHLLCVEQVPAYIKAGGWKPEGSTNASALPESGRPTDTGITVALPLIASDYSSFYTESGAFSTLANIAMEVLNVGENFVTVTWSREVHAHAVEVAREGNAEYEISCCIVNEGSQAQNTKKRVVGSNITVTGLSFNTLYELRVRKVSKLPSAWSRAVTVQTLDKVKVRIGPAGISSTELETQVGIGEDFIMLNWEGGVGTVAASTSFAVRCVEVGADGQAVGSGEEFFTADTNLKLSDLLPNRRYCITVRSITDDDGLPRYGEWSDNITLSTLSPMHVTVSDVTEDSAVIQWARGGEEDGSMVHTIGSYHIKIFALPKGRAGAEEEPKVLEERQVLETDEEFATRRTRLTSLKPGGSYTAMIRASTEDTWGAWCDPVTFTTRPLLALNIDLVGESWLFISWDRDLDKSSSKRTATREVQTHGAVTMAPLESCELFVSTVGKQRVHFSKTLPASPCQYRLEGLSPNTPYSLSLRPCYSSLLSGVWCEQLYSCTLAPLTVEVSRIGETFAHVQWLRAPQQRVATTLREQHQQHQVEFEEQQRRLQDEIDALKEGIDDGGAFENQFLAHQSEATDDHRTDSHSKLDQLLRAQQQQQHKHRQLIKLQELQLLELERITHYPDGEDMRYEVIINSTESGDAAASTSEDKDKRPFTFRRRINRSECSDLSCKLGGLAPHSTYAVTVRAMYSKVGLNVDRMAAAQPESDGGEKQDPDQLFWGVWAPKAELCTLKQISLKVRGIGSTHCAVAWDTGYSPGSGATAIMRYQLMVGEKDRKNGKPCQEVFVDNPAMATWTVEGLQVATAYSVTIRVCYDNERWGLWSNAVTFLTLPPLSARVTEVVETGVSLLLWREQQTASGDKLLVWQPKQSELQLSINDMPSPTTVKLDLDTSTLVSLDDLTIDSLYSVKCREIDVDGDWREWRDVVQFETLPAAPSKPILDERRGHVISLSWNQRQNRAGVQYLYQVEMGSTGGLKGKAAMSNLDSIQFQPVGLLRTTQLRLELTEPVHRCLFRVKACKEHQRLETDTEEPMQDGYLWSQYSPVAHFHAPSVPQPPTHLKIVGLGDTYATVRWKKPENWRSHTLLLYKVYLSASYDEKMVCLGSAQKCSFRMDGLLPNTHYRVGCTAESSMGVSQSNHVLHFSTRVLSNQGPLHGDVDNPTSSTLPPRNGLRLPQTEMDRLNHRRGPLSPAATAYSAAMSPTARSLAYSDFTEEFSVARSKAHASPTASVATAADQTPAAYSGTYPPHGAARAGFLPPVRNPPQAAITPSIR
ncbi:hypothetical protein DIPPA_17498 [Diplonema papillatum]|nr:hypothetical protein DIPPA_17498 [Diplonema papillatum]